jgi:type IV secretory pathway TrbD component
VFFTVSQVWPVCRTAGHFSYRGHAGLNRVRFNGRVGSRQLGAGTYRISARTRAGRTVRRMTLVVVDAGAPTRAQLAAARSADVCSATAGSTGASNMGGLAAERLQRSLQPKGQPSASGAVKGSTTHSGVLAASLEKTAEALRPVIVALLALAILLLAVASLPRAAVPGPRFHDVLTRHRVDLAGVGAVALAAVVIVFLFG